MFSYDA
jgi:hypothetical protein